MKKRILSILLAALMLCVLVPQLAGIASADIVKGTCGENVKWSFDTVTGILTISGTGDMDSYSTTTNAPWKNLQDDILKLVIEDGVTNVGGWAFRDYTALTSVTIADSVTNIGDRAFYGCTGLKSLTIGKGVTTIAKYAFSGCTSLSELNLNMSTIGNWFQGSTVTTLVLGDNVNSIGEYAFFGCTGLTSVTIPNSVVSIGNSAFKDCTGLAAVEIPDSVTSIGGSAFEGCIGLKTVKIGKGVSTIGDRAFAGCDYIEELTLDMPYVGNWFQEMKMTSLVLGDNVVLVDEYAFTKCAALKSVKFGKSIMVINKYAFSECTALTELDFNNGLTVINDGAFDGCTGLTKVKIPASLNAVGLYAFHNCTALNRVDITNLSAWCKIAFLDATANPLYYAKNLYLNDYIINKLEIPATVTTIGAYAFINDENITSVSMPNTVTKIGTEAFDGCTNINRVDILSIQAWCGIEFADPTANPLYYAKSLYINDELQTDIVVPDGVTEIHDYAFYNCSGLTRVILPESVTAIGKEAFYHNTSLAKISIRKDVTEIGVRAFEGCEGLNRVYIYDLAAWCGIDFKTEKETDTEATSNPLYYAHSLYLNDQLVTDLQIPAGTVEIKPFAFQHCTSATNLNVPNSVTAIGKYAFDGCSAIKKAVIGTGMTAIGEGAFQNCKAMKSIDIKAGITSLGDYAFRKCESLESIVLPSGVTRIGKYTFEGCSSLKSASIPTGVITIGEGAFQNCSVLEDMTVPNGVTAIETLAFQNCAALYSVSIPDSMADIGLAAFDGCTNITHVCYGGNSKEWKVVRIEDKNSALTGAEFFHWNVPTSLAAHQKNEGAAAATCTMPGCITYGCDCGHTWTIETAPALGHHYVDGVCTRCGAKDPNYVKVEFVDVPKTAYYKQPVDWAVSRGITNGMDKTHFRPYMTCTRGQVVTFLWRANGSPAPKTTKSPFTDVKSGNYYYKAVLWAVEKNITAGRTTTTFGPNYECTRAQVVTFMWRAANSPKPETTTNPFTDVTADKYYYYAVLWAVENNITTGTTATTFTPDKFCTRAQVVTFLYRAYAD